MYLLIACILLVFIAGSTLFLYGEKRQQLKETEERSKAVTEFSKAVIKELHAAEERIEEVETKLMDVAIENGDTDTAVDLLNRLFQDEDSDGELPN